MESTLNKKSPKYAYDCENCKFEWNCGYTCFCNYKNKRPEPPDNIKLLVNDALKKSGLRNQYCTKPNDNPKSS